MTTAQLSMLLLLYFISTNMPFDESTPLMAVPPLLTSWDVGFKFELHPQLKPT